MAIKKRAAPPPVSAATRWAEFDGYSRQSPSTVTIDCSAEKLEKRLRQAIENDADEILVRVAQLTPELDPANFQAIVRFNNRNREWACVVHEDAFQALAQAITQAAKMPSKTEAKNVGTNKSAGTLQDPTSGRKPKPEGKPRKKIKRPLRRLAGK